MIVAQKPQEIPGQGGSYTRDAKGNLVRQVETEAEPAAPEVGREPNPQKE